MRFTSSYHIYRYYINQFSKENRRRKNHPLEKKPRRKIDGLYFTIPENIRDAFKQSGGEKKISLTIYYISSS
jgi:hypothetical protein